jgi:DNA sulfur modification protein DndE
MEYPVERFRLSQTAKDQLMKLKGHTKIEQWNIEPLA